jgi:hypothetical protein
LKKPCVRSVKLLSHLENILPRRDWELHREAITRMVAEVYDYGFEAAEVTIEPTEAKL